MNAAMLSKEPLARLVLAVSAVELLAQQPKWSSRQKAVIKELVATVEGRTDLTEKERVELAKTVRDARLGIAEGCRRLLKALDLETLEGSWKAFYGIRSAIFHGRAPAIDQDLASISEDALLLCGRVVVTAVGQQIPSVLDCLDQHYPLPE
jgi:hypothetical protein